MDPRKQIQLKPIVTPWAGQSAYNSIFEEIFNSAPDDPRKTAILSALAILENTIKEDHRYYLGLVMQAQKLAEDERKAFEAEYLYEQEKLQQAYLDRLDKDEKLPIIMQQLPELSMPVLASLAALESHFTSYYIAHDTMQHLTQQHQTHQAAMANTLMDNALQNTTVVSGPNGNNVTITVGIDPNEEDEVRERLSATTTFPEIMARNTWLSEQHAILTRELLSSGANTVEQGINAHQEATKLLTKNGIHEVNNYLIKLVPALTRALNKLDPKELELLMDHYQMKKVRNKMALANKLLLKDINMETWLEKINHFNNGYAQQHVLSDNHAQCIKDMLGMLKRKENLTDDISKKISHAFDAMSGEDICNLLKSPKFNRPMLKPKGFIESGGSAAPAA